MVYQNTDIKQQLEQIKTYSHFCLLYEMLEEWRDVVISFITIGLSRGEKCLYIADSHTADQVRDYLKQEGIDVSVLETSRQLVTLHVEDTYLRKEFFDPNQMIVFLAAEVEKAVAEGYPALRISCEMSWLLYGNLDLDKILEYEAKLNQELFSRYSCAGLCIYDLRKFNSEVIKGVTMAHPLLVRGNRVYHNHYHLPQGKFLSKKWAENETDLLMEKVAKSEASRDQSEQPGELTRTLLDHSIIGLYIIQDGKFQLFSSEFKKTMGYSEDDLLGAYSLKFVLPEDRDDVRENAVKMLKGESSSLYEYRVVTKNGDVRWLMEMVTSIQYRGKRATLGNVIDITERKQTEEKYRHLLEDMSDGYVVVQDGEHVFANSKFCEMFGYEPGQIQGKPLDYFVSSNDREEVAGIYDSLMRGKEEIPVRHEVLTTRKDGTMIVAEAIISPIQYEGRPAISAVIRDVTERKQAEERYKQLVEGINDGYAVVEEGKVAFANNRFCQIFGYEPSQMLGKAIDAFLLSDDHQLLLDLYAKVMSGEEAAPVGFEVRAKRSDGAVLIVETNVKVTKYGSISAAFVVVRDITERKQIEEKIIRIERQYRNTIETALDVIINIDTNGNLTLVNEYALKRLGYTQDEAIGKGFWEFLDEQSIPSAMEAFGKAANGEAVKGLEFILKAKDGGRIPFEISSVPNFVNGQFLGVVAILRDLSERKQAEEKHRQLLEDMNDGYLVVEEGRIVFANGRFCEIFGYEPEQVLEKHIIELTAPDIRQEAIELFEQIWRGEVLPPELHEVASIKADGTRIIIETSTKPIQYEGKPAYSVIVKDITERKQMEEKHKQLLEDMNDGYGVIQDGKYAFVNRRLCEMLGCELDQVLGKPIDSLMLPEDRQSKMDEYGKVIQGEDVPAERYEGETVRGDGKKIAIETSIKNIQYEGKPAFAVIFRDITERKQAEDALIQSERNYRELAGSISDVFVALDKDLKYTYWNKAAERVLEISAKNALGKQHYDLFPDDVNREKVREIYLEVIKTKQPQQFITTGWFGDKGLISEISVYPSGDGVSVFVKDITAHTRAKEELEIAAREWRTTFDSISDMVTICDSNFQVLRVNEAVCSTLKMKPEEIIGRTCYELFHGTTEPVPNCPHVKTLQTKESASAEIFEPHLGVYLEVSTSPIFNRKGEVVASVHIIRDITERKNMEEQLMFTDRLASIGQLASGVAHEINNPLTSVIGFSELLLEKDFPDDVKEDLAIIDKEAKRAADVVKGLITFARNKGTETALVDINNVIQEVLQLRLYEQKVSNIKVNAWFDPDLPYVIVNSSQMQQVFMNLIINAEQAMLEANGRGNLKVTTEEVGGVVKITVADDGPGISREDMKKIFTPFFTTKEVGKGTGLGLSICHGIVTECGGKIYAESKLGKGASFILELPIPASRWR